jgi:hypothetical protein
MKEISAFCVVALLISLVPTLVLAQATSPMNLINKIKKIPTYGSELSDADFQQKSKLHKEVPMGDDYLSYEIKMPIEWQKLDLGGGSSTTDDLPDGQIKISKKMARVQRDFLAKEAKLLEQKGVSVRGDDEAGGGKSGMSSKILGTLAKYYGPTAVNSYPSTLTIDAQDLKFDISTKNWFLNFILSNGYTLEGLEVVNDRRVEGLYVLLDNGVSYIIRAVAEINGKRMVLVRMSIPESEWMAQRGIQEKVIRSFRFLSPETVKIGASRTYSFLDFLRFDYPVMWRLAAPSVSSLDSMDANLLLSTDETTLEGEIAVHIVANDADTTVANEAKLLADGVKDKGFILGDMLEEPDYFKVQPQVFYNKTQVYKLNYKTKDSLEYEYWITIMREDRYFYYVTLMTVGRSSSFFTWAKNTEAYQQVVESLRP